MKLADIFSKSFDSQPWVEKGYTGIGTTAGGIGSLISFLGFSGKPAGYFIIFCFCGIVYLVAWCIMKALVPKRKDIIL